MYNIFNWPNLATYSALVVPMSFGLIKLLSIHELKSLLHYNGTTFPLCLCKLMIYKNVLRTANFCLKILMTHFKIQNR